MRSCLPFGVVLIAAIFSVAEAPTRAAFSCNADNRVDEGEKVADDLRAAYAVFAGQVVAVDGEMVRMTVEQVWKGDIPRDVSFRRRSPEAALTGYMSISGDFHFEAGRKYLVFTYGSSRQAMIAGGTCGRSALWESAAAVPHLNKLAKPIKPR